MSDLAIHGGRREAASALFPEAPRPWIDLSTGINPRPYPARPASRATRARLPDPAELTALESAAARAFGAPRECVLATGGTEAAIRLLACHLGARSVAIVEPTYGGHRAAWTDAGATVTGVRRHDLQEAALHFDVLVVVNPNNPDGAVTPPGVLATMANAMAARGAWLIVDEAFAEGAPENSVLSQSPRLVPAINLRSFGKFYGLPGLRLGFVVATTDLAARLRRLRGEWPVSADAIDAGRQAYADEAWAETTRGRLARDADRLDTLLTETGFEIVGGTSLFRLAAADDAAARFIRLGRVGILSRPFDHSPRWLRFGLPAPNNWPRLRAALKETLS